MAIEIDFLSNAAICASNNLLSIWEASVDQSLPAAKYTPDCHFALYTITPDYNSEARGENSSYESGDSCLGNRPEFAASQRMEIAEIQ